MQDDNNKKIGNGNLSLQATSEDMAMLKQMNEAKFLLGVLNKNTDIPSQNEKKDPLVTLK